MIRPLRFLTWLVFATALLIGLTATRRASARSGGIFSDSYDPNPSAPACFSGVPCGCSAGAPGCHTAAGDQLPTVRFNYRSGGNGQLVGSTLYVDPSAVVQFSLTVSTSGSFEKNKGFNVADVGANHGALAVSDDPTYVRQGAGALGLTEVTHKTPNNNDSYAFDFQWTAPPGGCADAQLRGWGNAVDPGDYHRNKVGSDTLTIKTRCGNGTSCSSATATTCQTGQCVDNVCCNTSCTGECQTCNGASPGTCTNFGGAPPKTGSCTGGGTFCGGSCDGTMATCHYPTASCRSGSCNAATSVATVAANCAAGLCPAMTTVSCAPYTCNATLTACASGCASDAECTPGNFCDTGTCKPKKANAAGCALAHECTSGFCADGVCCNAACGEQCASCNLPGNVGSCTAVSGAPIGGRPACGTDGSPCGGACDGSTKATCAYPVSSCRPPACTSGVATLAANCDGAGSCPLLKTQVCAPYACAGTACATTCTLDSDCASADYCNAGACTPRAIIGGFCTTAKECSSGLCVDGVCCDRPCNQQCEACDVAGRLGTCSTLAGGQSPHAARPACDVDPITKCPGSCDGTNAAACGPGSCDAGVDVGPDSAVPVDGAADGGSDAGVDGTIIGDGAGSDGPYIDDGSIVGDAGVITDTMDATIVDASIPGFGQPNENGYCACRTTGATTTRSGLWLIALGAAVAATRRRARRRLGP